MKILDFFQLIPFVVGSSSRQWINEANFDNWKRWSKNMTKPCQGQTVSFSQNEPTSVMIRESFTVGILNLPNNGEIVLTENIYIGVDPSLSNCQDTEPVLYSSIPDTWHDETNWINNALDRLEFVVDERAIPCPDDSTILPQDTTFMIQSEANNLAETVSIKPWGSEITSPSG